MKTLEKKPTNKKEANARIKIFHRLTGNLEVEQQRKVIKQRDYCLSNKKKI